MRAFFHGLLGVMVLILSLGAAHGATIPGTLKWSFATGGSVECSPAIGADGTIYMGSLDSHLYALNPDGARKWSCDTGGYISSSPAIGADGTIYTASDDGNLHAVTPDGTLKWSFATGPSYLLEYGSSPAIGADGTVYVGSRDGSLYAFSSSSPGLANAPWPTFQQNLSHTGLATIPVPVPLSSGWNLISLPLQPFNTAIASVLSGIKGSCEVVWAYPDQTWKVYDPNDPDGTTLTTMEAGKGYWLKMTAPKTLSVSGTAPPSSLPLAQGWNLVGYDGASCTASSTPLSSIGSALQVSWGYGAQGWQFYDPTATAKENTLTNLCPGAGYWVEVNGTAAWSGW